MRTEIISIGDELLIGQTVNTNASWMGEFLLDINCPVQWITTIGDEKDHLLNALTIAEERAEIVLITGGLGPTHDDITKRVVCRYFGSKLVKNNDVLKSIKERFAKRNVEMAQVNEEQAMVPDDAEILDNDEGTAPGFLFKKEGKRFFIMPGVPQEMKSMMLRHVLPGIEEIMSTGVVKNRILCTTGIPESTLYSKLDDLEDLEKDAKLAFLPNYLGVRIRITAVADDEEQAKQKLDSVEKRIRDKVDRYIYADRDILLEEALHDLLIDKDLTLAVAESCTGGLIADKLTNVSGSSKYFDRGVVSYSNRSKQENLGVAKALLQEHGAVSEPVAAAMAEGIRELADTDFGISTTGIAGPTGGSREKPVGLVYIAIADEQGTRVEKHIFPNDRTGNKVRAAQAALDILRRRIKGLV